MSEQLGYVEAIGGFTMWRVAIRKFELWLIGEFTRENVKAFLDRRARCAEDPIGADEAVDFHAVCGDVEIPWEREGSEISFKSVRKWWEDRQR